MTSGNGIDGGELFRVRGPVIVQHASQPTIGFVSVEDSKFGMGSQIPFLVVFKGERGEQDQYSVEPKSFLHQGALIATRISLKTTQWELDVDYMIDGYPFDGAPSWYSDGSPAPAFTEEIEFFLPKLPGDEPLQYDLNDGRVFVVSLGRDKNTVEQLDIQLFGPSESSDLQSEELASFIYKWWKKNGG
ncbi:MAG: hypothetical protein AAF664_22325 [Planctomycetota bacterium]